MRDLIAVAITSVAFATLRLNTASSDPEYHHKWGYVDTSGKEVIAAKYAQAGKFNHGYAKCIGFNPQTGLPDYETTIFVDKSGREFPVKNLPAQKPGALTYAVNVGSRTIVQNTDTIIFSERNGYKLAYSNYRWFVIAPDKQLMEIRSNDFVPAGLNPKTNNYSLRSGAQYFEFTGALGKSILPGIEPSTPPDFIEAYQGMPSKFSNLFRYFGEFTEGLNAAWTQNKQWKYVDRQGDIKINLPADCCGAYPFGEGLAAVAIGGIPWADSGGHSQISSLYGAKFGFIDKSGKFVIPPKFPCPNSEWTSKFTNGLALATAEKNSCITYGYINVEGEFVIQPKYSRISEFSEGFAAFDSKEPGFDPVLWRHSLNRYELMTHLLRQYDLLSMQEIQVEKFLGKPEKITYCPDAVRYQISADCSGSNWFAIRYDSNRKVMGYGLFNGDGVVPGESPPPTDWIVTPQQPTGNENLHDFFKRAKVETYPCSRPSQ